MKAAAQLCGLACNVRIGVLQAPTTYIDHQSFLQHADISIRMLEV